MKYLLISFIFLLGVFNFNECYAQCVTCVGDNSALIGTGNTLTGTNSFITGNNSVLTGNSCAIIGSYSANHGTYSYITGFLSTIDNGCISSYIFGENCTVQNTTSMLLGYHLKTTTGNSFALGCGNLGTGNELTTTVPYSLIIGFKSSYPTLFVGPTPNYQQSGRVGIGNVSDPLAKLHIKADAVENADLLIEAMGANKTAGIFLSGSLGVIQTRNEGQSLKFITNNTPRITIEGYTGNVGIGTDQPSAKLEVTDGDIFITDIDKGIIMKSPDGNCWRGTLNNEGQLVFSVLENCTTVSVKESKTGPLFEVYPNPATGYVTISMSRAMTSGNVLLFNIKGGLVISAPINNNPLRLDVSNLEAGTYLLKVVTAEATASQPLIIR